MKRPRKKGPLWLASCSTSVRILGDSSWMVCSTALSEPRLSFTTQCSCSTLFTASASPSRSSSIERCMFSSDSVTARNSKGILRDLAISTSSSPASLSCADESPKPVIRSDRGGPPARVARSWIRYGHCRACDMPRSTMCSLSSFSNASRMAELAAKCPKARNGDARYTSWKPSSFSVSDGGFRGPGGLLNLKGCEPVMARRAVRPSTKQAVILCMASP
ncbi:hypothetical protein Mapa_011456 [Marchantia paleacea]|nr:hypothetical protein Mapa_011456 [Marchantia paleacea]